ncbi:MAG: hypothetical protein K0R66_1032 [Gammaproteobacteria bacterium]|jgi:hypothetical protein|nr:hypothetical protein [Gammaproteobacteria bacterium]
MRAIEVLRAIIELHNKYYKDYPASIKETIIEGKRRYEIVGFDDNLKNHDLWLAISVTLPQETSASAMGPWRAYMNNVNDEQLKRLLAAYEKMLKQRAGIPLSMFEIAVPFGGYSVDPRLVKAPEKVEPAAKRRKLEAESTSSLPIQAALQTKREESDSAPDALKPLSFH